MIKFLTRTLDRPSTILCNQTPHLGLPYLRRWNHFSKSLYIYFVFVTLLIMTCHKSASSQTKHSVYNTYPSRQVHKIIAKAFSLKPLHGELFHCSPSHKCSHFNWGERRTNHKRSHASTALWLAEMLMNRSRNGWLDIQRGETFHSAMRVRALSGGVETSKFCGHFLMCSLL